MPIAIEIPFARRGPACPVAPEFKSGGKALVAAGTLSCATEAAPFVAATQAFVCAEGDEMVDIVAARFESNIKTHEDSRSGLEPFGKTATVIFAKTRLDSETAFSATIVASRRE